MATVVHAAATAASASDTHSNAQNAPEPSRGPRADQTEQGDTHSKPVRGDPECDHG